MSRTMKPITLHGHAGPNGWKVALILEELSIPYETKIWATADQKKPPFTTTLNPNGFTPVIEDPNTNTKLWESGAIILYLLETYDSPNHLISFASSSPQDRAHLLQYHFFQCTFQGPNLSAALYFTRAKPNPEARQRYVDESIRVLDVLEKALQTNGTDEVKKEWLVGGNCTAADLVFVPYMWSMELILGDENPNLAKGFPNVEAWMQRMSGRATIKKVKIDRDAALAALAASIATSGQGQQK